MSSGAFWFGSPARSLFAQGCLPDGTARGAVVLCPALGYEAPFSRLAYRGLAERLARRGMAVLRVDYDGTGDAWGSDSDPGRAAAWLGSVSQAVDLVRRAGAAHVSLVGVRLGALLAAGAARACAPDAMVLWDPYPNGRAFLREQQLMVSVWRDWSLRPSTTGRGPVALPGASGSEVEILGSVFDQVEAEEISRLTLGPVDPAVASLLLVPRDRPLLPTVRAHLAHARVELIEQVGKGELMDTAGEGPGPVLDLVADWLGAQPAQGGRVMSWPEQLPSSCPSPDGAINEEVSFFGRQRLFTILSRPAAPVADGPVVVLLNAGHGDHLGPGRLWVNIARELASSGVQAARIDLRGLGDSPGRPGRLPPSDYPGEALSDLSDALGEICGGNWGKLVLVGLCSGAYHGMALAARHGARSVIAINPNLPPPSEAPPNRAWRAGVRRSPPWLAPLLSRGRLRSWRKLIEGTAAGAPGSLLLCGPGDIDLVLPGWRWACRRTNLDHDLSLHELASNDHAFFTSDARAELLPLVRGHLARCLAGPAMDGAPVVPAPAVPAFQRP